MRYAIWNNKGGVGKTFFAFNLASYVAEKLLKEGDKRKVVIIDMCPQANVSEIILGGNGTGTEALDQLIKENKTVGSYFYSRLENSPYNKLGTETDYLTRASNYNNNIPENLHIFAGDPSLELQIPSINSRAADSIPDDAWIAVHRWVKDLMDSCNQRWNREAIYFIDCNPSFAAYTEIALVASNRIIVPCSPDGSSARAVRNVARLVYGHSLEAKHERLRFSEKMSAAGATLPTMHLFIMNRSTIYSDQPAQDFQYIENQIRSAVTSLYRENSDMFSAKSEEHLFNNVDHMPDAHRFSVVTSKHGIPLCKMVPGRLYGSLQVTRDQLTNYQKGLSRIAESLDLAEKNL